MYRILFLWLILLNNSILTFALLTKDPYARDIKRIIELIQRRGNDVSDVEEAVSNEEDQPKPKSSPPGHTLIQPTNKSLASAIKYPKEDPKAKAVYGNLDNLGITYGKTKNRWLYTNFRKSPTLMEYLTEQLKRKSANNFHVVIPLHPIIQNTETSQEGVNVGDEKNPAYTKKRKMKPQLLLIINSRKSPSIMDWIKQLWESLQGPKYEYSYEFPLFVDRHKLLQTRRKNREVAPESDTDESSSSGSSDYEKNPGNPYTVHKDKYKQNWMWNHFMDGSHMNLNPYAPQFNSLGPSGAALFFGRKWWYFNHDDFQPMN